MIISIIALEYKDFGINKVTQKTVKIIEGSMRTRKLYVLHIFFSEKMHELDHKLKSMRFQNQNKFTLPLDTGKNAIAELSALARNFSNFLYKTITDFLI